MAAPSLPVLDNFNRANGGLGANWTTGLYTGSVAPQISTNAVAGNVSFAEAYWNPITPGPDTEVFATVTAQPATGSFVYLHARNQSPGTSGMDAYELVIVKSSGTDSWELNRVINESPTNIATRSQEIANGDSFGLVVLGTGATVTIQIWYRASGGSWTQLGADVSDTNASRIVAAGRIGGGSNDGSCRWDDFGGGTQASGTNYNITGNLSSTSATPDTAAQTVSRALAPSLASLSATPNTSALLVSRALTSALPSTSSTPDTATLETALQVAASIASTSSTPDTSAILVSRALIGSVPATSSTPDTATLGLQRPISAAVASASFATNHPWLVLDNYALRFYGTASAQIDRVRIPLRSGASPTTADVGAGDFTYEAWLNCLYADNTTTSTADWRFSNIVMDRDVWNGVMGHGLGVARGGANLVAVFGVAGVGLTHVTLAGTSNIGDGAWHHVAVVRRQSTGLIELYVDGALEDSGTYSTGDLSYDDSNDGGQDNDAIILGTEKHDVGAGYSGLLDSLRISTTRRYTAGFTPAANFVPDASTAVLYHHNQGTGTVLGDSATLAGSPTNGALLVGGPDNGPTWELSSLFTKRLTSAVASASSTPTGSALVVSRALAPALASLSTTPDAAALLISRALTVALASQSVAPDTAALIVARSVTGALASQSATPDTTTLLAVVQFIAAIASGSATPDTAAILVSRALVAALASQSTTPDDAELAIAGLISLVGSIASQSTTPDAALLAVSRTLTAAIASQSSSPDAASLLVSRALSVGLASLSTTPDASALLVARRLIAAIASQSTTPDDAELFAGGVIGMMRATLTARAPSVTFTARTPSVTFTVEE